MESLFLSAESTWTRTLFDTSGFATRDVKLIKLVFDKVFFSLYDFYGLGTQPQW